MKDDNYWAGKYGLVPVWVENKVDGGDLIAVEWSELKLMFEWLEDNYEIGIGRGPREF